jgi:hypothetical protein
MHNIPKLNQLPSQLQVLQVVHVCACDLAVQIVLIPTFMTFVVP